jgi:hypothetical protein
MGQRRGFTPEFEQQVVQLLNARQTSCGRDLSPEHRSATGRVCGAARRRRRSLRPGSVDGRWSGHGTRCSKVNQSLEFGIDLSTSRVFEEHMRNDVGPV